MSALPAEDPEPEPVISALEEAMRQALAAASRERVVSIIASGLLVETDAEPDSRPPDAARAASSRRSVSRCRPLLDLVRARVGQGEFSRYVTERRSGTNSA